MGLGIFLQCRNSITFLYMLVGCRTCVHSCSLAHILVKIKFAHREMQVFHCLVTHLKPMQVAIATYKPMKYRIYSLENMDLFGHPVVSGQ